METVMRLEASQCGCVREVVEARGGGFCGHAME